MKHFFIPDNQVKPGVPLDHLRWIGEYIVKKQPEVIINIGDFADMPSLSSYDRGKKSFEGRRYIKDVEAAKEGMRTLMQPLLDYNAKKRRFKEKQYKPRLVMCLGNHEYRIIRAIEDDSKLDGTIGIEDLEYEKYGWEVHDFLKVVEIDGILYSHFFASPMNGRPYGGENINLRLNKIKQSFSMGHQQTYIIGIAHTAVGKPLRGLVAGACYLHNEDYKGYQGNHHWRGVVMKNDVQDGNYNLVEIDLNYLCRFYEGMELDEFLLTKYPDLNE